MKRKPVVALNDISFTVDDAAFLVLSGASGSGKSTVLQLISGIEQPTSGQIMVGDQDLTKMSAKQLADFRRKNIGIVFQQFYLEPTLTLRHNIELPAMFLNTPRKEREARTEELATMMGLQDHLDHLPSELSGGQIQRAAVARAIYNKPSILIADEPTSSLDQTNLTNVVRIFKQIQETYGTTIVIATHDPNMVQFASQIVKLDSGSIAV